MYISGIRMENSFAHGKATASSKSSPSPFPIMKNISLRVVGITISFFGTLLEKRYSLFFTESRSEVSFFQKNDSLLLTGSIDTWARLFTISHGKWQLAQRFEGHSATIWSASFSPDERQILTGSLDHTARIWNIIDSTFMNSTRIAPLTERQKLQYGLKD